MDKLFIASVIPAGIHYKNGQDVARFSVYLDINHNNPDLGSDSQSGHHSANADAFYAKFLPLSAYLTATTLTAEVAVMIGQQTKTFQCALSNQDYWQENCDLQELKKIRQQLWNDLFTAPKADVNLDNLAKRVTEGAATLSKQTLDTSKPVRKNVTIKCIDSLNKSNTFYNEIQQSHADEHIALTLDSGITEVMKLLQPASQLFKTFAQGNLAAEKYKEINKAEKINFIARNHNGAAISEMTDIHTLHELVTQDYVALNINLDELFTTFSQVSHHPILMRLFGLISDMEIPLAAFKNSQGKDLQININSLGSGNFYTNADFVTPSTALAYYVFKQRPLKALITGVPAKKDLYNCTILRDDDAYLLNYDPMGQEQKISAVKEKVTAGQSDVSGEFSDSFTRGVIYNHRRITDIITPLEENDPLYEENITMGHRVIVKDLEDPQGPDWISLTKRNTSLYTGDNVLVYDCGHTESCIHFDHVGNYMDEDTAKIEHKTSEALFEYKGEQLTLNTVFSREIKSSAIDNNNVKDEDPPDQSTYQSQTRINNCLDIDYFPYDQKDRTTFISPKAIKLRYALPEGDEEAQRLAELRFGDTYQFLVFCQYRNGWALPLKTSDDATQASIKEVLHYLNPTRQLQFTFKRLENPKPVILFPQKEIHNDNTTQQIKDKDALLHLVIRDIAGENTAFRHVLPERISLEHAYWAGLIVDEMLQDERIKWKCRYNCTMKDPVSATQPCDEGCSAYCGGTKMADFYPGKFIPVDKVMYLPDPLVDGFFIELYWDKDCTIPIGNASSEAIFQKQTVISVQSYGLQLTNRENPQFVPAEIKIDNPNTRLDISIKQGMRAYAQIYNHTLDPDNQQTWGHDFWLNQLFPDKQPIDPASFKHDTDPKVQPTTLTLTNTSKQPLVPPVIIKFFSSEKALKRKDPVDLKPVQDFIDETVSLLNQLTQTGNNNCNRYQFLLEADKTSSRFLLDNNIIGLRAASDQDTITSNIGSTKMTIDMVARFERLDARDFNLFLDGITPTGELKLIMKKEEFVDERKQYVLENGQNPENPVHHIDDKDNVPAIDYEIKFDLDTMRQLKRRTNATSLSEFQNYVKDAKNDPFRDTVTELKLHYDAKSTKFEYRNYQLVNTSKFKGYYTQELITDQLKDYQLVSPDFSVMLLNNKPPIQPQIAFMLTTIQQWPETPKARHQTIRHQRGNIITIYVNRGQYSSGGLERFGILIRNDGDYSDSYAELGQVSTVGKDVVTDSISPRSLYINYKRRGYADDIIIPPDINNNTYDARYDATLGIVSYLPDFDIDKQLWKFEVEFDIRGQSGTELHNPFLNLSIVRYQPFSINYHRIGQNLNLQEDCRLSKPYQGTFCYLLPERTVTATFKKPTFFLDRWGEVTMQVAFEKSSLNISPKNDKIVRSNFIFCVEGSSDEQIWYPMMSQVENADWQLMHPLIDFDRLVDGINHPEKTIRFRRKSNPDYNNNPNATEDHWIRYHKFRIRLVEIEWFSDEKWKDVIERYQKINADILLTDVLDKEDLRLRFVDLIY